VIEKKKFGRGGLLLLFLRGQGDADLEGSRRRIYRRRRMVIGDLSTKKVKKPGRISFV